MSSQGMRNGHGRTRHLRAVLVSAGVAALVADAIVADRMFAFALDSRNRHGMMHRQREDCDGASSQTGGDESRDARRWFKETRHSVRIRSDDGLDLYGWVVDPDSAGPRPHRYAICCHGFSGGPGEMATYARRLARMGFTVLLIAQRCHERSQGRYVGMGWLEHYDLLRWIDMIVRYDARARILLDGVSMGAATVMMASGDPRLPGNVAAAIADCGFTSAWDQFLFNARSLYHLPRAFAVAVVSSMSLVSRIRAGYGLRQASSVAMLANAHIPMLFIHGAADDFVSPACLRRNFEACSSPMRRMLVIAGAGHATSADTDPNRYWRAVAQFVHDVFDVSADSGLA